MGKVLLDKFPSKLLFLLRSIVFPFRKEQSQLVGNVHEFLRIGGFNRLVQAEANIVVHV